MAFYKQMRGISTDLLTRFNQGSLALVKITPGTGPAHNPGPPVRQPPRVIKGAASAAYSVRGGSKSYRDGTMVLVGDIKVVVAPLTGVDPAPSDKITIDGKEYNIVQFDKIPEPGVTVAWVFYVRR